MNRSWMIQMLLSDFFPPLFLFSITFWHLATPWPHQWGPFWLSFKIFSLYRHAQAKQYQCCPGYICSFTCETLSIPAGLSEPWPPAIDYDLITKFNKHKICPTATWNECRFPTAPSKSNWVSNLFSLECGEQRCGFWSLFPRYHLEMEKIRSEAPN